MKAGYEPGQTTSFTPSRQAEWIQDFNQILGQNSHSSRNKITELLLEKGIQAYKHDSVVKDSEIPVVESLPVLKGSVTLKCDNLSSEQKELLQTSHYQNLLEEFVLQLFGDLKTHEQKLVAQFTEAHAIEILEPNEVVKEIVSTVIDEKIFEFPKDVKSNVPETMIEQDKPSERPSLPAKETQPRRKANMASALNFVKSTQIND